MILFLRIENWTSIFILKNVIYISCLLLNFLLLIILKNQSFIHSVVNNTFLNCWTSSLMSIVSLFYSFYKIIGLSKLKLPLYKNKIIFEIKKLPAYWSNTYINWCISKANTRSYFLHYSFIYTITLVYFNQIYDNTIIVSITKL